MLRAHLNSSQRSKVKGQTTTTTTTTNLLPLGFRHSKLVMAQEERPHLLPQRRLHAPKVDQSEQLLLLVGLGTGRRSPVNRTGPRCRTFNSYRKDLGSQNATATSMRTHSFVPLCRQVESFWIARGNGSLSGKVHY